MYLKQKELLWELDHDFIKELMDITTKEAHEKGEFIFHEGDPAGHMYVLMKGRVKLKIEKNDQTVYVISHPGEMFGWSSIAGRGTYSVSAECMGKSQLNKIDRGDLLKLLNQNNANGMIFYKKLSEMLGHRLQHLYALTTQYEYSVSHGSGQLQEILEPA